MRRTTVKDEMTHEVMSAAEIIERRALPGAALASASATLTAASQGMADRFRRGATLLTFGEGGGLSDAHHIAVEFVHPAVVGTRALPALALHPETDELCYVRRLNVLAGPNDIAIGVAPRGAEDLAVLAGLSAAHDRGLLTVALTGPTPGDLGRVADHLVSVPSLDPLVIKEVHVTAYHLLWEMTQLFMEGS